MSEDTTTLGVKFERAICAAALCFDGVLDELPVMPAPEDFLSPGAGDVWGAILQCKQERGEVVVARVSQIVNENGADLVTAGRVANLADPALCSNQDAKVIASWLKARTLMHRAMSVTGEFYQEIKASGVSKAPDVIERFAANLQDVAKGTGGEDWAPAFAKDIPEDLLTPDDGTRRLATGWEDVDEKIRGWPRGKFSIIAARPSMGKSLLAISAAKNLAQRGLGVGFMSMEMHRNEIWVRLACDLAFKNASSPEYESVLAGKANPIQRRAMESAIEEARQLPFAINDKAGLKVVEMHRWLRRLDRYYRDNGKQLDAVFVDYLQLARPEKDRKGNKVNEVSDVSADLVAMAKDLDVALIALSQLSREPEKRGTARPQLSDLRDSGALEQDADLVGLLFRPAYYFERKAKEDDLTPAEIAEARQTKHALDIDWQKNRNGKTGITRVFCAAGSNAVRDKAPDWRSEAA